MDKKLKNSPIVEAVCEFKFKDFTNDLTIYGTLHDKFKNEYKKKKTVDIEIPFLKKENGKLLPNTKRTQLQQYLNEDEKSLIQVGKDILTINKLKPYNAWSDFFSRIETAFKNYIEVTELNKLRRIGLRYINKINFKDTSFTFTDNFKFLPLYDESFGEEIGPFFVGIHFPKNDKKDTLKIELTNTRPENGKIYAVLLDLDYFTEDLSELTIENSLEWVKRAHEEVENAFFNCITMKLETELNK